MEFLIEMKLIIQCGRECSVAVATRFEIQSVATAIKKFL
jgi:hypothetical protein